MQHYAMDGIEPLESLCVDMQYAMDDINKSYMLFQIFINPINWVHASDVENSVTDTTSHLFC